MHINNFPFEILEQILIKVFHGYGYRCKYDDIKRCSLVCRVWNKIASALLWKEVIIGNRNYYCSWNANNKDFYFLRHITNPKYNCGKYIRKLSIYKTKLYPLSIAKILRFCPNITSIAIRDYTFYGEKGDMKDLLGKILELLPNLREIDLSDSTYFDDEKIQKLIDTRKNLKIKATRDCPKDRKFIVKACEIYKNNKWICNKTDCPNNSDTDY
jgi:F-box-like